MPGYMRPPRSPSPAESVQGVVEGVREVRGSSTKGKGDRNVWALEPLYSVGPETTRNMQRVEAKTNRTSNKQQRGTRTWGWRGVLWCMRRALLAPAMPVLMEMAMIVLYR